MVEENGRVSHRLSLQSNTRRSQSVGKPMNLLYQPVPDLCSLCSDDTLPIDGVSRNSPMATNSARYSTREYPLLKTCVMFLSALFKIKSTSWQERYSFFTPCARKDEATTGEENTPTSTFLLYQTAFYFS